MGLAIDRAKKLLNSIARSAATTVPLKIRVAADVDWK